MESLENGVLLCVLLAMVMAAVHSPAVACFGIRPMSPPIVIAYALGVRSTTRSRSYSRWHPEATRETHLDEPEPHNRHLPHPRKIRLAFFVFAVIISSAGSLVAHAGIAFIRHTGLSETIVGALFTAAATSLPEPVTSIAAVKRGAPALAVGGASPRDQED